MELKTRHLIFVYGTLKRGFTNWHRYLGVAESHGAAHFVGAAQTVDAFPMVVRPPQMAPTTCAPVMMDLAGTGSRVLGEMYRVDDRTLEALDILEGVKSGAYYKRTVAALVLEEERREAEPPPEKRRRTEPADWLVGQTLSCTAYFFPASEQLLALELRACYTADLHALYTPKAINEQILALCKPASRANADATHGLATRQPKPMATLLLRLLPGDDLLGGLRAFAAAHGVEAAVVLSCVGSTATTTLRPAGVKAPKVLPGDKFEIVSLTGTVSASAHHLHLSVADADCVVRGGHLLEGCVVRTTAEIALGVVEGVSFSRPHDPRTGYDELSIDEV